MLNNPYEVLGISPNASNDEVKKAYRDFKQKVSSGFLMWIIRLQIWQKKI